MISAALFAGIMAILSQFTFPIGAVPITLQSFVCALAGGVLGRKWGAISIGLWLALGMLGIPILTMGKAGIGIFLSPVGGYLPMMSLSLAAGKCPLSAASPGTQSWPWGVVCESFSMACQSSAIWCS